MAKQGRFTTQYQHRHLRERLNDALRKHRIALRDTDNLNKPAHVKKAEVQIARLATIVSDYTDALWRGARKKENALNAKHAKVMEKILFSTPDVALRLVKEFEALK